MMEVECSMFRLLLNKLQIQNLIEWLDSYEQALALALLSRGDRYRLFANDAGDHLVWAARWETPQAAQRAAEILQRKDPTRSFSVRAHDRLTVLIDCADEDTKRLMESLKWSP